MKRGCGLTVAVWVALVGAYAAVRRGDFETMVRLVPRRSLTLMQERSDDLPLWQSMRPRAPALVSGWMTDEAATLTVRGATPKGEQTVAYHLEKSADGWRIRREWFP